MTDVIRRSPRWRGRSPRRNGTFSPDDPARFESIGHALRYLDHYMAAADFDSYYAAQRGIERAPWQVMPAWTRASILNVARMPWFSSDRTIREYAEDIWHVPVRGCARLGASERPAPGDTEEAAARLPPPVRGARPQSPAALAEMHCRVSRSSTIERKKT